MGAEEMKSFEIVAIAAAFLFAAYLIERAWERFSA
jgi:hypothetical protein